MDLNDDKHLDVCEAIESELRKQYDLQPELTDTLCIWAIDNAKIGIKQQWGFAKNERVKNL